MKFKSVDNIVILFSYFACVLRVFIFLNALLCVWLLTKEPSLRSMRAVAASLKIGPPLYKPLGYGLSHYKSTCTSTVYNKQ